MKIGSNNSLTYLEPSSWWLKIFKIFIRHQRRDYEYQYKYCGVRYFDIRVSYDKNNRMVLKDRNNTYKVFSMYEIFDFFNKFCDVTVSLTLDESLEERMWENNDRLSDRFKETCRIVETIYPCINFCGGYRRYDNKKLYRFDNDTPHIIDVDEQSKFYSIVTRFFPFMRKRLNNKYIEKFKFEEGFLVLNYVDYKA
jgi:hypothetical protein